MITITGNTKNRKSEVKMETKICSKARTIEELKEQAKIQKIRPCDLTIEDFVQMWIVDDNKDYEIADAIGALEKSVQKRRCEKKVSMFAKSAYYESGIQGCLEIIFGLQDGRWKL